VLHAACKCGSSALEENRQWVRHGFLPRYSVSTRQMPRLCNFIRQPRVESSSSKTTASFRNRTR
jgi:hypothetical protein